jgi:Tfp pilus assembly protein PilV
MNINADLEFVLLGSFFIAVAVLGAAGVIRTLRKKKVAA